MKTVFGLLVLLVTGCTETYTKHAPSVNKKKTDPQPSDQLDSLTDPRDGETYAVVIIGNQIWMAENLRYHAPESKINSNNPSKIYGRVYDWTLAQKVCPEGWHLPSDSEWSELEIELGMSVTETPTTTWRGTHGTDMKSESDWAEKGNGTNSSNFNVFPGGHYFEGEFNDIGFTSGYWTSTGSVENNLAWVRFIAGPIEGVNRLESHTEKSELFCRCVKD